MQKKLRITESELIEIIRSIINEVSDKSDKDVASMLKKHTTDKELEIDSVLGNMVVKLTHPHFFDDLKKRERIKDFLFRNGFRGVGGGRFIRPKQNDDDGMGLTESKVFRTIKNILNENDSHGMMSMVGNMIKKNRDEMCSIGPTKFVEMIASKVSSETSDDPKRIEDFINKNFEDELYSIQGVC